MTFDEFTKEDSLPVINVKTNEIIQISEKIGLNVMIKNTKKNKGTITFSYHDYDQLNKIIEIIKANY